MFWSYNHLQVEIYTSEINITISYTFQVFGTNELGTSLLIWCNPKITFLCSCWLIQEQRSKKLHFHYDYFDAWYIYLHVWIPITSRGGLYGCEMLRTSHCLDSSLIDGGKVVSRMHRPHFTPQKHDFFLMFLVLISVRGWVNSRA
jgi:hypothetical protein